jgi:hypothetical protein
MRIRKATGTDAPALSALALRSKAHWGYSAELLSLWSGELEISADFIHQNPVFVACWRDREPAARAEAACA